MTRPANPQNDAALLTNMFDSASRTLGPQHWWPAQTPTEIILGAILTQNTAWTNVRRAIDRLKSANMLSLAKIHAADADRLAELIRSSGTYRVKARRLKSFTDWLFERFDGSLDAMFSMRTPALREALLAVDGIGPETADAILLYAGGKPTFVIDAYTLRILRRHLVLDASAGYHDAKCLFEKHLPPDADLFNEYHALLVAIGKNHCRPKARCDACPLRHFAHDETL